MLPGMHWLVVVNILSFKCPQRALISVKEALATNFMGAYHQEQLHLIVGSSCKPKLLLASCIRAAYHAAKAAKKSGTLRSMHRTLAGALHAGAQRVRA